MTGRKATAAATNGKAADKAAKAEEPSKDKKHDASTPTKAPKKRRKVNHGMSPLLLSPRESLANSVCSMRVLP